MAKPPINVHVSSSDFKSLLEAQKASLGELSNIKTILELTQQTQIPKVTPDASHLPYKISNEILDTLKDTLKGSRRRWKLQEDFEAEWRTEAKNIASIASSMNTTGNVFSQLAEKLKTKASGLRETFSAQGMMKAMNFGGIFNKSIEKDKFMKQQRLLGNKNVSSADFEVAYQASKDTKKNEAAIARWQKDTGLGEEHMHKYDSGRALLDKRQSLADTTGSVNWATDVHSPTPVMRGINPQAVTGKSPTQAHADEGAQEERDIEATKHAEKQDDLLVKIEENTRGASPDQKIKPKEGSEGGGLLSGLLGGGGGGMGKAMSGLKNFGVGLVLVAASLWVAAKAFQSFAEVAWEDVTKGLVVLAGLVGAAVVMDKAKGSMMGTALGLGVMALSIWGISEAFQTFQDLDWGTILKGFTVIGVLVAAGALLGEFAPLMILFGAGLAALGAGVWVIGKAFQEMGEAFNTFVDGIERLSNIGFEGLAGVAAGLALLGPAMALFAAGNVAAGVGNLVTGFLSAVSGQKSPIDQLIEIGKAGDGINKAGSGMERLAKGMVAFGDVKEDSMKTLNKFPWERAALFVAAGGTMSVDGAKVYNASKGNADEAVISDKPKGNGTTVVNAPVTNNSNHTNIIRPQIRNQESSVSHWLKSRFA